MAEEQSELISTHWLHQNINNTNIRILDVTWYSGKNAHDDYLKEHIPGAVFFDIFKDACLSDIYPRNVPDAVNFQANARNAGITNDTHVVVYDSEGKCGFFVASRAWWTFMYFGHTKVSILDGGLQKWKGEGYETTDIVPTNTNGTFTAKIDNSVRTTLNFMKENRLTQEVQILDSRHSDVYKGKLEDPKSGHYPGAINIPFAASLLDHEKKQFKTKEELQKVFEEHGVNLDKPIATMCNSGMSSCSLLLAARLAGNKQSSVYQSGFTEWKSQSSATDIEQS